MKHTTWQLYGIKPEVFAELPYREALETKKKAATVRLAEITKRLQESLDGGRYESYASLLVMQLAIIKALKHNEKLLKELGDD